MDNTEAQQVLFEIIEQAQNQKFTEFRLITSWVDFSYWRKTKLATKLIIGMLDEAARNLFKSYCKTAESGTQDVQQLLAYTEIRDIRNFYEKELETIQKMIDEYDDWLGHGNFLYSFFGGERDIWN